MSVERATRLNGVIRRLEGPNRRPCDASSLIVVDRSLRQPRILMGQRHMGHKFMPGVFVFPGGRVDRSDFRIAATDSLDQRVEQKLVHDMKGGADNKRALALALAGIRETFEETGILIGKAGTGGGTISDAASNRNWRQFLSHGVAPCVAPLTLIARAITPPRRPRRFDTRFFCVDAAMIAGRTDAIDDELECVEWTTLEKAMRLKLAPVTKVILEEVADRLNAGTIDNPAAPASYYRMRHGRFIWSQI